MGDAVLPQFPDDPAGGMFRVPRHHPPADAGFRILIMRRLLGDETQEEPEIPVIRLRYM